jgi:hypothetical protein
MGPPPLVPLSANPLAAIISITVIMSIIVLMKLYTKAFVNKQFGPDDWTAIIGAVRMLSFAGFTSGEH